MHRVSRLNVSVASAAGLTIAALCVSLDAGEPKPAAPAPAPAAPAPAAPAAPAPATPAAPAAPATPPPPPIQAPEITWSESLLDTLIVARDAKRAVMAVFLLPDAEKGAPAPGAKPPADPEAAKAMESQKLILSEPPEFRLAAKEANLLAVKVRKPSATDKNKTDLYRALLKRYAVEGKLPALVFLAPDGSALGKLCQPADKAAMAEAVKAVPALFAKWESAQRTRKPGSSK
jgi:hypothetical protein